MVRIGLAPVRPVAEFIPVEPLIREEHAKRLLLSRMWIVVLDEFVEGFEDETTEYRAFPVVQVMGTIQVQIPVEFIGSTGGVLGVLVGSV